MMSKNDIRYRATCPCGEKLGDWALRSKSPRCWKHKNMSVENIKKLR